MVKLQQFQFDGVCQVREWGGRALIGDEMGLGKTIQALFWAFKHPQRRPVVIVCPASLKWNWQSEAENHFGLRSAVLEGRAKKGDTLPDSNIFIINYDILPAWLKLLRKAKPQILIIDEIQFLTNHLSKRSKAARRLSKGMRSVIGLSGTPFANRPIELWHVLKVIKPNLFPSREKFAWRYCAPRYTPWGWRYDGSTNRKELNGILRDHVMIRRLKKDVLLDLPDKVNRTVAFKLGLKARREYTKAKTNFIGWLSEKSPTKAAKAKKSLAMSKIGYLLRLVAQLKLNWTAQWIADFFEAHPDKKLICFTRNTFVIEFLLEKFPHALVINGDVKNSLRPKIVRQFQNNPKKNLFLGNWKAAGVGLTLTAAHNVVALDLPWTPADMDQGGDRAHRIGQEETVTFWHLVALDTIEEWLAQLLTKKRKIQTAILDGKGAKYDVNIFEELLEIMNKETK